MQSISSGSKVLIRIDETRKALRKSVSLASGVNCRYCKHLPVEPQDSHRALVTADSGMIIYIHLSGHFTCRLEERIKHFLSSTKISSCRTKCANSVFRLSICGETMNHRVPNTITSSCKDISNKWCFL